MAVVAPEVPKAATLDGQEVVHVGLADIAKWEDGPDGTLYVYGRATTPEIDTDDQIVSSSWSGDALKSWLAEAPAVRVQHNGQRDPAGSGVRVDVNRDGDGAHWLKAAVDEPTAQRLVRKGHLRAFSVGIARPVIERDSTGKARGGIINGGRIVEVSLVDSPANRSCFLEIAKAAGDDGHAEFTGKVFGADLLTKDAVPTTTKGVTVTLPKNMSLSVKPSDLAKLATFKQQLVKAAQPEATKGQQYVEPPWPPGAPDPIPDEWEAAAHVAKAAEAGIYKRDIDTATRRRLAGENRALPDLSYPIETHEDAHNAATLALSGHGDVSAAKRLIKRIASKEGWTDVLDRLKGGKKKKVATPAAEKKMKVMCPSCGAKQNKKHAACSECGRPLANAMAVAKNHDFKCLGCGKDPLDKGEKFCPDCGTANPGYNPMADKKIPANEDKTAAPAVVKAKKKGGKGKKGKPFGGAQAAPFGADDKEKDPKDDGDDSGKDKPAKAGKAARVTKGSQSKGKGKKGGKKPTPASAGGVPGSHTDPVPAHREPDGGAVEAFEADAGLEDGDGMEAQSKVPVMAGVKSADPEMAASLALKALDIPADLGALHALTCPAYAPADVGKAFPHASFSGVDEGWWQGEALSKAASAPLGEATAAMELWNAARALKQADPYLTQDLREAAHKAFRDANPGPSSFPTPGELSPQRFNRPLITEGHEAPSPGHDAPHSVRLPQSGGIVAAGYQRGYLDAGHASDGPENQHTPGPVAPPASTGMPTHDPAQGYVTHMAHDSASHAIGAMHDHISRIFPDVCPMNPGDNDFRNPVPSPTGGVTPAPGARKAAKAKAKKTAAKAKRKAAKARKAEVAKTRKLDARVHKAAAALSDGETPERLRKYQNALNAVAKYLGISGEMVVLPAGSQVTKGVTYEGDLPAAEAGAGTVQAVVTEAVAPLAAALKKANRRAARAEKTVTRQGKTLRKVRKTADAIASQPDTSGAPFRGVALNKTTSAPPVEAPTPAGTAEQAQLHKMRLLQHEALNSNDPSARIAAWGELDRMLGIAPTQPPQYTPLRQ